MSSMSRRTAFLLTSALGLTVVAAAAIWALHGRSSVSTPGDTSFAGYRAELAARPLPKIVKIGSGFNTFGCLDAAVFEHLDQYVSAGDQVAFDNAMANVALDGRCVRFMPGETVYPQNGPQLPGLIQVLRKGDGKTYWTSPLVAG